MGGKKGQKKSTPLLQPSIEVVNCPEPNCIVQRKRSKMKEHFSKLVSFDEHGKPHIPGSKKFDKLSKPSKEHTKYFYEKTYDINTSLGTIFPGSKFSHAPKMNPFDRAHMAKKRKLDNEDTVSGSKKLQIDVYEEDKRNEECANETNSSLDINAHTKVSLIKSPH